MNDSCASEERTCSTEFLVNEKQQHRRVKSVSSIWLKLDQNFLQRFANLDGFIRNVRFVPVHKHNYQQLKSSLLEMGRKHFLTIPIKCLRSHTTVAAPTS